MTLDDAFGGLGGERLTMTYADPDVYGGEGWSYKAGKLVGGFFRKYGKSMLMAAALIFIILISLYFFGRMTNSGDCNSKGGVVAMGNAVYHSRCKSRGGCSRTCPYVAKDDPRLLIHLQSDEVRQLASLMSASYQDTILGRPNLLAMFKDDSKKIVDDKCTQVFVSMKAAVDNTKTLVTAAKSIDHVFGDQTTITSALVNAKNRMAALRSASIVMSHYFVSSLLSLSAFAKHQFILQRTKEDPAVISDDLIYNSTAYLNDLQKAYAGVFEGADGATATYTDQVNEAASDSSSAGSVIEAMVKLMTMSERTLAATQTARSNNDNIEAVYRQVAKSGFTNKLPGGDLDRNMVSAMINNNDYDSAVKLAALEPEIAGNHAKFAKERASFDSGGGVPSVRDDDNDVIKWVGLFGRPTYRRTDGSSAEAPSGEPLRSIPSDRPEDVMREKSLRLAYV